MEKKIKVLIAEDSPVVQLLLVHVLNADPDIQIIGTVPDGQAAVEFVQRQRPDVVLMDIHMPRMDGFEATRQIMRQQPLPIVICSATMKTSEVENTFLALEAGAIAAVDKPVGIGHPNFSAMVETVLRTIKEMAAVHITRHPTRHGEAQRPAPPRARTDIRLVVIGASTGGPPVLHEILSGLPADFGLPILIVQHIAVGFLDGMVEWLRKSTGHDVRIAAHNELPQPGRVYVAPDQLHMGLLPSGRILLSQDPPENGLRPAVSFLFRTAAAEYGAAVAGILLTGMGRDGAEELKRLRETGALTIAQDKDSCVVHGMAGEAIKLGAAAHVLPPAQIASTLASLQKRQAPPVRSTTPT